MRKHYLKLTILGASNAVVTLSMLPLTALMGIYAGMSSMVWLAISLVTYAVCLCLTLRKLGGGAEKMFLGAVTALGAHLVVGFILAGPFEAYCEFVEILTEVYLPYPHYPFNALAYVLTAIGNAILLVACSVVVFIVFAVKNVRRERKRERSNSELR